MIVTGAASRANEFQLAEFEPKQRFENQVEHVYTFNLVLPVDPKIRVADVEILAGDPDFPDEGVASFNGKYEFSLFGEQADAIYDEEQAALAFVVPWDAFVQGENTLTIRHEKWQYFTIDRVTINVAYTPEDPDDGNFDMAGFRLRIEAVEADLVEVKERVGLLEGFVNRLKALFSQ